MDRLIFTTPARQSLKSIIQFYNTRSIKWTKGFRDKILRGNKTLLLFPYAGKVEPILADFPNGFRSFVIEKHFKMIYYINENNIYVVLIWDCRQDSNALLREMTNEIHHLPENE